ncbi:PREDICTED: F-box protein At5g49610-like [Fragaria vesca subsp. vesca]|uniref:F-box protein At5g49610-like n=1 Tax=Fragaria vesca subsp. vesca TaxID=101020 RepID=UPI0002C35840|nr:PREDICTED: F-box protein At5g49610-like [Fragaria vesca subsp. vesca]
MQKITSKSIIKTTDISINDLPDHLLVEVLCRLPIKKFCLQCTSVCRRWCSLISDPYFAGRFLCLQRDKRTPIICTLINHNAEEFLTKDVFQKFRSFLSLKEDPFVLGTWNDLVLCCASKDDQHDYYICNPYTMQLVTLPRIPACHEFVPMGFICEPYYKYEEEDVFSSETGEWTVSVVSSPRDLSSYVFDWNNSFANNGMIYWMTQDGNLIGLGPFVNNNSSSSSYGDHFQCRLIEFDSIVRENFSFDFLGVYQRYLRMCDYDFDNCRLFVWELTEEHDQLVANGPGKCGLEHGKRYSLPREMIPRDLDGYVELLTFDPN